MRFDCNIPTSTKMKSFFQAKLSLYIKWQCPDFNISYIEQVLRYIKDCILATDLALFFGNKAKLKEWQENTEFDWHNTEHRYNVALFPMMWFGGPIYHSNKSCSSFAAFSQLKKSKETVVPKECSRSLSYSLVVQNHSISETTYLSLCDYVGSEILAHSWGSFDVIEEKLCCCLIMNVSLWQACSKSSHDDRVWSVCQHQALGLPVQNCTGHLWGILHTGIIHW